MDSNDYNEEDLEEPKEQLDNNPPALDENEGELDILPPKNGSLMGVASKALINFLLKKKIIAIGIIGLVILLFICIFFGANVSSDSFEYKYMESLENKCDTVEVVYAPYGSNESNVEKMDLEEYVGKATYTYTKDLKNIDEGTYHLYKALAIALRVEAISNGCRVTYKDKELEDIPASEGNIIILNNALESADGVVVSKAGKKKLMSIKVSDFCYNENDGTNYTIFQVPDFNIPTSWVNENVPSKYKDCPCNRPNESLTSCYAEKDFKEWIHKDDESGFNVYAAYYLLEEYKLNWSDILQYFIGDHNYWTINKEDEEEELDENCGTMDLHKTTLSKTEFIAGMKNFNYNGESPSGWQKFVNNAEMIYEVSLENNINPEFVVVRAILEGFSPGESKNNYWGWTCYNNNTAACTTFDPDFEKAVAEYCQAVYKQYTDYNDLLRSYAYLGDYWYTEDTPAPSSDGGCYYAPYIFPDGIPDRVQQACNGPSCVMNGDTTNCTKTTAEEQILYGKYQDRNTQKYRKEIWNLSETDCKMTASGAGCMWWPIGSKETTIKDDITYADGDPETTTITSGFGLRNAPLAGASTNHSAIDIGGGREGETNIIAAADGVVTNVFTGCIAGNHSCGGQLGNYVYISHNDGSITRYGHMYSVAVKKDDIVKQGQVIGKMGNTGNSTGPHLDFQVQVNGQIVDPTNYVSSADARKICSGSGSVVSGDSNQQTVCLTLKNSGYSDKAVAGIMGNLKQESEFKTDANNSNVSYGIAQWQGDRLTKLKSTYGSDWLDINNQLKFLLSELNSNDYVAAESYLRENHDERDHAYNFCMLFEDPGETDCKSTHRMDYAAELLPYVKNGCK